MNEPLPYWVWLVAGLALCAAETVVPGAFLIWIGAAGLILGAIDFLLPLPLAVQTLGFAALAAGLALVGRRVYGSIDSVGPSLPASRAARVDRTRVFLEGAIEHGFGRIRVDDSVWRVAGQDLPEGVKVRVVGIEDGVGGACGKGLRSSRHNFKERGVDA